MISRMVSRITLALKRNQIIPEDEIEIYQYGLEMIASTIVNCLIVVVIGMIMKELLAAVLFFIMFAIIRSCSGGYHADTYLKCNSIFAICLLCVLFWVKYVGSFYSIWCHLIFITIYIMLVVKYTPVENQNKPLTPDQSKRCKLCCIIYGIILTAISLILWFGFDSIKYAVLIAVTLLSVAISIAASIISKGGEDREKDNS